MRNAQRPIRILLALLAATVAVSCSSKLQVERLAPNIVRSDTLQGSPLAWRLTLEAGHRALLLVAVPDGVEVRLKPPHRDEIQVTAGGEEGGISFGFVADSNGEWELRLDPGGYNAPLPYRLQWQDLGSATAKQTAQWDSAYVYTSLLTATADGDVRRASKSAQSLLEATVSLSGGTEPRATDVEEIAYLLFDPTHREFANLGIEWLGHALTLASGPQGDLAKQAELEETLSTAFYIMGQYAESAEYGEHSLEVYRGLDTPDSLMAYREKELALCYEALCRWSDARALAESAVAKTTARAAPDQELLADLWNTLGQLAVQQGDPARALVCFDRAETAAKLFAASGTSPQQWYSVADFIGIVRLNRAGVFFDQARYDEAERMYRDLAHMWKSLDDRQPGILGKSYLNVGETCRMQGRFAEAEEYLRLGILADEQELGPDNVRRSWNMSFLGRLLTELQRYDEADTLLRESIRINEASGHGRGEELAYALRLRGELAEARGDLRLAVAMHRRCVEVSRQVWGDNAAETARSKVGLARALVAGVPASKEAENLLDDANGILSGTISLPLTRLESRTLLAGVLYARGQRDAARTDLARALDDVVSFRSMFSSGDTERGNFFADYARSYRTLVEWYADAGDIDSAFRYLELFRAQGILEGMQAAGADFRAGIDADTLAALEARERELGSRYAELTGQLRQDHPVEETTQLINARDDAYEEWRHIQIRFRQLSPVWRKLMSRRDAPVSLSAAREELLNRDECMVAFQIGDRRSLAFVIPGGDAAARVIPLRVTSPVAEKLGVDAGELTAAVLSHVLTGSDETVRRGDAAGVLAWLSSPDPELDEMWRRLEGLFDVLFPESIRDVVMGAKGVVILPDGLLHRLPIAALVVRRADGDGDPLYWVDEGPALRYAPSATVLSNLAQQVEPVARGPILSVCAPEFGGAFPALPGTVRESNEIVASYRGLRDVTVLQGADATEAALRAALPGKAYIHLASHGFVEDRRDDVVALLALSPGVGDVASPLDDGFLELEEILQLRLDAELVVLSACETHLGEWIPGDGVYALTRGFLSAGARRVVGTTWRVGDDATARVVGGFFDRMASSERNGESPDFARALQESQRVLRRSRRSNLPVYWAPFILIGQR